MTLDKHQLIRDAKSLQEEINKDESKKLIPIEVREVAEKLGIAISSAQIRLWKWHELGIVKYIAGGKGRGDWYWIGVK